MSITILTERYSSLRAELDTAYAEPLWSRSRADRIDRIAAELIHTEMAIGAQSSGDEQTDDSFRGFAW